MIARVGTLEFVDIGAGSYLLHSHDGVYEIIDPNPRTSGLWDKLQAANKAAKQVRAIGTVETDGLMSTTMSGKKLLMVSTLEEI